MKKSENNNTQTVENPSENVTTVTPIVKIKNLSEKAIVIKLEIGKFAGTRRDARVSKDVASDENTTVEYVRVTKSLMKSEQSKAVQTAEGKLRNKFYELTSPWTRDGEGVCRITNYLTIKSKLEELSREYMSAVDDLVDNYSTIVEADKLKLGTMFNIADYPGIDNFRSRFYVNINVIPIEKTDFRSGVLNDAEIEAINNQIEERVNNSIKESQKDNLRNIKEKLYHLFQRIRDIDSKLHNSSLSNALDEIRNAKELNISDDSGLDKLFDEITESLSGYNIETVRINGDERAAIANSTKDALEKINAAMESFM